MLTLRRFAPAKITLYLHVTGRRADGYHLLDSLVVFASCGDVLTLEPAPSFSLKVEGPMAAAMATTSPEDNLVVRAARALGARVGRSPDFRVTLTKNLPLASGIGGGSADAAAMLRLLAEAWDIPAEDGKLQEIAATLGADVPCCLASATCYFRDTGAVTDPGPALPGLHMVLANPGKPVSTPSSFRGRTGPFDSPARLEGPLETAQDVVAQLRTRRNALTESSVALEPVILKVLTTLESSPACLLARMLGSGATCMGLFAGEKEARTAADALAARHPDWWIVACHAPRTEAAGL